MIDLLNDYLMYIQVEKNLADRTVQEYRMDLELLISFLQDRKRSQWQEVTHHDLRHFLFHLQQVRKNSATARARKVSSIKGFFRYLYEEGYISSNPSLRVSKPKLEKKLPFYLTQEDCLRFIQVVHEKISVKPSAKEREGKRRFKPNAVVDNKETSFLFEFFFTIL